MTVRRASPTRLSSLPVFAALLVAFALLPAIARAGQLLVFGPGRASGEAGLHKVVDAPPELEQPAADRAIVFRSAALDEPASRLSPCRSPLPAFQSILTDGDTLRAPPGARTPA